MTWVLVHPDDDPLRPGGTLAKYVAQGVEALIYDLSHPIVPHMPVYPGDPDVLVDPTAGGEGPWRVSALHLGTHSGTHVDAPAHFLPGGQPIDAIPLDRFMGTVRIVQLPGLAENRAITADQLVSVLAEVASAEFLLLHTGWDEHWGTERYFRNPYLSWGAAQAIAEARPALVGVDLPNVDSTADATSHAHGILLRAGVLIAENLTGLGRLQPDRRYTCALFPLRLAGLDGSPVRAVAWEGGVA